MGKPNPKPQQVHCHENDHSPHKPDPEDSTQAMLHDYLTDGGIDQPDIDTVVLAFKARGGKPSQDSSRKIKVQTKICLAGVNQSTNHLVDWQPMEVFLVLI